MKLAAVATVYNEADIIGLSVEHLLAHGIDHIYVAAGPSTDGTTSILHGFPEVTAIVDDLAYHDQPGWTNKLADIALTEGATWIIPFDADEFLCAPHHDTIREAIASVSDDVTKLWVTMWHHVDWERRHVEAKPHRKVVYRAVRGASVTYGNHDVAIPGEDAWDVLSLRELQYRSYDHFKQKIVERNTRMDPAIAGWAGTHHWNLKDATEEELQAAWTQLSAVPLTHDPIPLRSRPSLDQTIPTGALSVEKTSA